MHKRLIIFLLIICSFLLTGCSDLAQIEDLAFAEILGIDTEPSGVVEVSIKIPKITGQRGESGGSGSDSPNLLYSAKGNTFDEALTLLQWTVPRRLDLSQIKLIVVSESLARSESFGRISDTIMAAPRLYTAARLAVCDGSAKEFVAAEEPVIGTRLASELTATFEDYIRSGFIPDTTFADYYYGSKSFFSDTLAIRAVTAPESKSGDAQPVSAIIPDDPYQHGVEMQHSNRFLGAAVFRKGQMVGLLSGEQYMYCKMLRGESQTFPFSIDGKTVGLASMGAPSIRIDTSVNPMQINADLNLSIVSSSRNAPTERLEKALCDAFTDAVEACRAIGAEPLNWAGHAAGCFLTYDDWQRFNWSERFLESDIRVNVHIFSNSN